MQVEFEYRNHHGKVSTRAVDVDSLEYHHKPGFGYLPGWAISGFDRDKAARRTFFLTHILLPDGALNLKHYALMKIL